MLAISVWGRLNMEPQGQARDGAVGGDCDNTVRCMLPLVSPLTVGSGIIMQQMSTKQERMWSEQQSRPFEKPHV